MGRQSELIKKLREGLTQEEFAAKVGVTQKDISRYEREIHNLPLLKFLDWCKIMEYNFEIKK